MTRVLKAWMEEKVDALPVAEHRYTDDLDDSYVTTAENRDWRKGVPYKPGEVVYAWINGKVKRARIYYVILTHTRAGERLEKYRCAPETARGIFSRRGVDVYPRHIQKAYEAMTSSEPK